MDVHTNDITNARRLDVLKWDEFFMGMALLEVNRHSKSFTREAAVLINKKHVVVGLALNSEEKNDISHENHAEFRAVNKVSNGEGMILYSTNVSCEECAKAIIEKGIEQVVYLKNSNNDISKLFSLNKVRLRQFESIRRRVILDFNTDL